MIYSYKMKNNAPMNQERIVANTNIITSLANNAIINTEGVATGKVNSKKIRNVGVFINKDAVSIDVYVDVVFGYNVSRVACVLQEKIINDVKNNTGLNVKNVNVNVVNVIFN